MNKVVNVLQVLNSLGRGGIETFITNVYKNTDNTKVHFDFAIMEGKHTNHLDWVISQGAKVYVYPKLTKSSAILFYTWWSNFFSSKGSCYSVVHIHAYSTASIYLKMAHKAGVYTIVHSHTTKLSSRGKNKLNMWIRNRMLIPLRTSEEIDARFACSKAAGNFLFGMSASFQIVPNAIELPKYKFETKTRNKYRDELNLKDAVVIGHVGNAVEAKNHMFLLRVFRNYHSTNPNSKLMLIGKLDRLQKEIDTYVETHCLSDVVLQLGVRSDVPQLMMAMDIFAMPSIYEGLGMALVEAQATGLPCVASNAVPEEAFVSDTCVSLPLQNKETLWADTMFRIAPTAGKSRINAWKQIEKVGYDTKTVAKKLQAFYIEASKQ